MASSGQVSAQQRHTVLVVDPVLGVVYPTAATNRNELNSPSEGRGGEVLHCTLTCTNPRTWYYYYWSSCLEYFGHICSATHPCKPLRRRKFNWAWGMVNTGRTLTCSANRANTMRQKMVSVMTSASCRNEWSNALMIVFRPGDVFLLLIQIKSLKFCFWQLDLIPSVINY